MNSSKAEQGPPLRTILVVEREAGLRRRLTRLLAEVPGLPPATEASTVPEALDLLRRAPFDAVVLGVSLAADGFRWLPQLRRAAAGSVLVALGDDGEPEVRERCRQLGADAYFVVSLELDRIGEALLALGGRGAKPARGKAE